MAVCSGITYDAGNDRITVDFVNGDVKGDSFNDPYTFQDIYDTDVDGGWGVFQKYGNVYISDASILIEGADTYFQDSYFHLNFNADNISNGVVIEIMYSSNCYLGKASFGIYNISDEYCSFDSENIELYDVHCKYSYIQAAIKLTSSSYGTIHVENGAVIDSCIASNPSRSGVQIRGTPDKFTNITAKDSQYGIYLRMGPATLSNIILDNNTYDFWLRQNDSEYNIIDSQVDIDSYKIRPFWSGYTILNLKSTFKVTILFGDGATATLYDQFGSQIAQQTLLGEWELADPVTYAQRYVETDGSSVVENTKTVYEPFKLMVSKSNYQTLEIPNITVTAGEKTNVYGKMTMKNYVDRQLTGTVKTAKVTGTMKTTAS